jgi:hypothetical protein
MENNMTLVRSFMALTALAATSACVNTDAGLASAALAAAPVRDGNALEVERFFMAGIGHFNRGDLEGFLVQFDEDIRMYAVNSWLRGKPVLRQRFRDTFKQFPQVKMEITNLRARSETPNTVTVDFEFHTFPRGTESGYHGVGSGVYVKRAVGWREVMEHESVTKRDAGI